jgi:hypothetical protein
LLIPIRLVPLVLLTGDFSVVTRLLLYIVLLVIILINLLALLGYSGIALKVGLVLYIFIII